jgi:hypothetical protein
MVDPHLRAASQDTHEVDNCEAKRDEYSMRRILGLLTLEIEWPPYSLHGRLRRTGLITRL